MIGLRDGPADQPARSLLLQDLPVIDRVVPLLAASVALACFASHAVRATEPAEPRSSVLDVSVPDINGKPVNLAEAHRGKVLLLVNTASRCGYTPQYEGLETLYEKYRDRGFEVLAFPANEFGAQEPGTNAEIKSFCTSKYNVTFPLYSKIVVKGEGIHPLYKSLTSPETDPKFAGDIKWNFTKFLVNRKGEVIARFEPKVTPTSEEVTRKIEAALADTK